MSDRPLTDKEIISWLGKKIKLTQERNNKLRAELETITEDLKLRAELDDWCDDHKLDENK